MEYNNKKGQSTKIQIRQMASCKSINPLSHLPRKRKKAFKNALKKFGTRDFEIRLNEPDPGKEEELLKVIGNTEEGLQSMRKE